MIPNFRTVPIAGALSVPCRRGPPRSPQLYLLALEYLLWDGKRPHGLQKTLAYGNGFTPGALSKAITNIASAKLRPRIK